jgi:diacylglycerol kinase (ATP)
LIVALGGDGTISEVANGILAADAGGTTELGIIPRGTGGDFRRMLGLSTALAEAATHVREKPAHAIDVGRVTYTAHDGSSALRYFVNVASFGFSSAVASKANASSKRLGGKLAFLGATLRSLATYDNTDVWLSVDGGPRQRRRVLMAAVGNGRFFGGGMKICPLASLDSGRLDLVVVGDLGRLEVLMKVGRIYGGSHLTMPDVRNEPVGRLEAVPAEDGAVVPLELDGETPGRLPAVFEVMPGALRVRF